MATIGRYFVTAEAIQHKEVGSNIAKTATNIPANEFIQQGVDERKERDRLLIFINAIAILLITISFLIQKFL